MVIWLFSDGKPGHDNQTLGLTEALARQWPLGVHAVPPPPAWQALGYYLRRRFPPADSLPDPTLILGAGQRTHLAMLAARRARGGRAVVLMRPSLPLGCFDLCVIPEHDHPPARANVLETRGVLNRILPSQTQDSEQGLFLIGGPSAHFAWNDGELCQQIAAILAADAAKRWVLTTSRRTPPTFLPALATLGGNPLSAVPYSETTPDWVPAHLSCAAQVWVTADSVSMVYEALTAGAAVGILAVPKQADSRVSRGLEGLLREEWVTPFQRWQRIGRLTRPLLVFNEAERCALDIGRLWLA